MRSNLNSRSLSVLLLIGFVVLVAPGCRKKATVTTNQVSIKTTVKQTSSFDASIDFLNNLEQFKPTTVDDQILGNLRDWSGEAKASIEWSADPMFNRLPQQYKQFFTTEGLAAPAFERFDVNPLKETVWMRDIARNVATRTLDDPTLKAWLSSAVEQGQLSEDLKADLTLTYQLFDWTIRNTQLDSAQDPDDVVGDPEDPNAFRHQYEPWENVLYGHADWLERSRIFILLCRQMGIDAVMLVAERDGEPAQPWAVGVLIGKEQQTETANASELYLFDALLGVPLPGQGRAPFGRLSEYINDPTLLDKLSVGSSPYRLGTSDLENLTASIEATQTSLSQRMKQVESRLKGKLKMVLTVEPTSMARELRNKAGIKKVEIWPYPFRRNLFFRELANNPTATPNLVERLEREQIPFLMRSKLMQGRLLQFRGKYKGGLDDPGANELFLDSRLSKQQLKRFSIPLEKLREISKDLPQPSPFLEGLPKDPAEANAIYQERVSTSLQNAIWNKDNATIWMAMTSLDNQQYEVAQHHLGQILENKSSRWHQQARYNMARAHESLGKLNDDASLIEAAIELYESDKDSPQYDGNLLRAATLRNK